MLLALSDKDLKIMVLRLFSFSDESRVFVGALLAFQLPLNQSKCNKSMQCSTRNKWAACTSQ